MATIYAASRQQIREKFLAGQSVSATGFYGQYSSSSLLAVRAGLERDFDEACGGDPHRQPKDWLQDRMAIIDRILEARAIADR